MFSTKKWSGMEKKLPKLAPEQNPAGFIFNCQNNGSLHFRHVFSLFRNTTFQVAFNRRKWSFFRTI